LRCGPAIRAEGSAPGVAKKIKNTTTLIPNHDDSICANAWYDDRDHGFTAAAGRGDRARAHAATQEIERQHGDTIARPGASDTAGRV